MPTFSKPDIDALVLELQGRAAGLAKVAKGLRDGDENPAGNRTDRDGDAMLSAIACNLQQCMEVLFAECCEIVGRKVEEATYQDVASAFADRVEENRSANRNWSDDEHRLSVAQCLTTSFLLRSA